MNLTDKVEFTAEGLKKVADSLEFLPEPYRYPTMVSLIGLFTM